MISNLERPECPDCPDCPELPTCPSPEGSGSPPECPDKEDLCDDETLYKILMIVFACIAGLSLIALIIMAILCQCREDEDDLDSYPSETIELEPRKTQMPPDSASIQFRFMNDHYYYL